MYLVILLGLAIPLPLAIYLLALSALNRGPHPVLVPGAWDFAMVLFASSGFLVFGGPAILAGLQAHTRDFMLFGPFRPPATYGWHFWIVVWTVYFVCVLAAALYVLAQRRRATSIYNVEPTALRQALGDTLDRLRLEWVRDADQVYISPSAVEASLAPKQALAVRLEAFPALRHVTLYWPDGVTPLRHAIEEGLEQTLAGVWTRGNAAASWMFSIAACLFMLMLFTVVLMILFVYFLQQATP